MIKIIEKNDLISWDTIHNVLWEAHAENREHGIIMSFPSLSGMELKEKITRGNGKVFLAMDGEDVIGTAAYTLEKKEVWFCKEPYMYLCLECILPQYKGKGIYKELCTIQEMDAVTNGIKTLVLETHEHNKKVIAINEHYGFNKIAYKRCLDHNNVIMVKWIGSCPFSIPYLKFRFYLSKLKVKLKSIFSKIKEQCRRNNE